MPYAPVNGLSLYYEEHGSGGVPLLLVPGGHLTIDLNYDDVLPALSSRRRVVAVEQQGHGRTADVDRTPTLPNLADDLVGLLDHLGLERVDVLGFSLGGLAAMDAAIRYPDRFERFVFGSGHVRPDGYHPEIFDPSRWATSTRMPTAEDFAAMQREHERLAPPGDAGLDAFMAKLQPTIQGFTGWSDEELARVRARTLIMIADHDFVAVEHAALELELIPDARLAVIPNATHNGLLHRADVVLPILEDFLAR
ncbi:alpha/beta hydrolase [Actinomycetospora endophytica]|uniref:Alpha/beta hydrolase n=1 Tax=Actinomycetospora endophytica TaxID=2291215 RepID=A0ABS8PAT2_9PSEU|nr:alpha/beta hydrolase [Actinomycetospora endophytica]MCD2194109.1 alpha/beta hydrolase [Actinomycetospora endophytica]